MEQNEYEQELNVLKETRESEKEIAKHALELERQKTKTEKAKQGTGRLAIKLVGLFALFVVIMVSATWLITLFMPNNVEKAFEIVKNLFN